MFEVGYQFRGRTSGGLYTIVGKLPGERMYVVYCHETNTHNDFLWSDADIFLQEPANEAV